MVYAGSTCATVFKMQCGDVFWCTADCGWITGHTYLTYGPLLNGATVVFEECQRIQMQEDVGKLL